MGSSLGSTHIIGLVGGLERGLSSEFALLMDVKLCDVTLYAHTEVLVVQSWCRITCTIGDGQYTYMCFGSLDSPVGHSPRTTAVMGTVVT